MSDFFTLLSANPLLLYAIFASIAASIAGGIVGTYVVVKRIVFIAGSISHAVLGGIGFFVWLERVYGFSWASPLLGALLAAIASALIIGWMHLNYREREDSAIAALWSIGMATGVLFISQTPGYTGELANYLIGNIFWVSEFDLLILLILDLVVVALVFCLHQRFLALCFDETQARLQGVRVHGLYLLLLILIAITIVLLIEVVGIILVLTMLTIPAAIANIFQKSLSAMMVTAIIFGISFSLVGMALAYHLDWPAGATIALLTGISYLGCTAIVKNGKRGI